MKPPTILSLQVLFGIDTLKCPSFLSTDIVRKGDSGYRNAIGQRSMIEVVHGEFSYSSLRMRDWKEEKDNVKAWLRGICKLGHRPLQIHIDHSGL